MKNHPCADGQSKPIYPFLAFRVNVGQSIGTEQAAVFADEVYQHELLLAKCHHAIVFESKPKLFVRRPDSDEIAGVTIFCI